MGTLTAIIPVLGLIAGTIIATYTKAEIKQGKKYLILLQNLLLSIIITALFWNFKYYSFAIGALAFIALRKTKFTHPILLTPVLAAAALNPNTQIPIFLYLTPTGTLNGWKKSIAAAIAYILIAIAANQFL